MRNHSRESGRQPSAEAGASLDRAQHEADPLTYKSFLGDGRRFPNVCGICARLSRSIIVVMVLFVVGCGAFNPGKWRGIEKTAKDEQYYLVKDVFLTGGGSANPRESFDHNMHEVVSLFFLPANEKNTYIAETRWLAPDGLEYRTIRTTYDKQAEGKQGIERSSKGSMRVHTVPTQELFARKPGEWKVLLYLDGKLVRRLPFSVR